MQISIANAIQVVRRIGAAAAEVITTNLKMWLGFETSSIDGDKQITPDKSGNNNVGELFTGKALDFGGSVDKVDVLNYAYDINCVVFWIKPLSTAINQNFIWFGGTNRGIKDIKLDNNLVRTQGLFGVSVTVNNVSTNTVNLNEWSRVVVTFNQITTTQISFGYGGTLYADILLSNIQVFSTQWSADDISYDYANPQNFIIEREGTSITANDCKGYWHLSEGSGNICYDSSKEGNNGVISGATYEPAQPRIPQLGMMNWSKGSNLFSYSQDFSQWNKEATVTLTPNYGTSPSGANDSTRMQMNANDSLYLDSLGSSKTFSIYVKGTQGETIRLSNGVGQSFTLTGNWDRIQLYDTSASSTLYSINTYSGATARDMEIWGGQLEDSSSASAYRLTDGATTSNSTVIPNPTTPTQDIFGNAVRDRLNSFNLDGSGYAEVADDADLDMSSGFSTSFWVKLDEGTTTTDYNFLVCKGRGIGATNSTYGFGTTYYNNNIIATINTSVSKYQVTSSSQNPTGQWLFVCVTYEPNTTLGLKLYLDDNLPNSITVSGTVDESHNLNVGRDSSFITTRQSKNIISDVLFYDSVLTSDEIENNYNAGLSAHTN